MRLIDADALIAHLKKDPLFGLVEKYGISGVIDAQPTINAEPVRHGKWIDLNTRLRSYSPSNRYKCSVCGECSDNFKYCPNCGARMDEE